MSLKTLYVIICHFKKLIHWVAKIIQRKKNPNEMLDDPELTKKATIARDVLPVECSLARFRVAQDRDLSRASQGSGVNGTSFTVTARYENDIKGHVTGEVRPDL